jgi:hypothetical protein
VIGELFDELGPGSGPERQRTVDLGGAVKLVDAASGGMRPYLEAKAEADQYLTAGAGRASTGASSR